MVALILTHCVLATFSNKLIHLWASGNIIHLPLLDLDLIDPNRSLIKWYTQLQKTVASKFSFQPQEQNDLPRLTQISLCHLLFYTSVEGYSQPRASALFLDKHSFMGLLRIWISYYFPNKSPFHIFSELASL